MADKPFTLTNDELIDILTGVEEEPDWLIPNLIAQGGMVVLVGESHAGKSYLTYTLSLAMAAGVSALSGLVPAGEPRRVAYFDDENSTQDRNKYLRRSVNGLGGLKTKRHPKGLDLGLLYENFYPLHFRLGAEDWMDRAAECIDIIRPHCLVFDTAASCFDIADENDNAQAQNTIKGIRHLMKIPEKVASSIVVKHAKTRTEKGGPRVVRGAKVWKDLSDSMLFLVRASGRPRDGLSPTRLLPDKVRAYGLPQPLYISPDWTDDARTGLVLRGSYQADREHRAAERADDEEDD